ncbi:MAG: type II toxin-antitoxin system RelE/ParE family toxin [Pseudomonadales bacterium]|nr:type II toxin-antitoxin system RelE/ParE family toxin [Pseudomonadales bacterium]HJN51876.1 type II toxin-antitoxin system RelE/ParE family toxin [Pseudomonadales bacterium]
MAASGSTVRLRVSEDTTRLIRHSHPKLKRRIKRALSTIIEDPYSGKALTEELRGLRSFRMGRIRIIYAIASKKLIEIVAIGPRKPVYEETYRIISRE